MTVIYDSRRKVNNRPFGKGLLPTSFYLPHFRLDITSADRDFLATDNARRAAQPEIAPEFPTDAEIDQMALWATGCDDAGNSYHAY